jgi:hypothetical protein
VNEEGDESFCFFFQKEARSSCSFLKKRTKKRSSIGAILVRPIALPPGKAYEFLGP